MSLAADTLTPVPTRPRMRFNVWLLGALISAMIGAGPIVVVLGVALFPTENIWPDLVDTMLPRYLRNTGLLMLGVGVGTTLIGVASAWIVTMCRFPGRRWFEWGLLLPMAMPAYLGAYVYTDLLEFAGPVQGMLRDLFGWQSARDYWFPDIRTMGGAVFVLTLTLYPYVYLLTRAAFLSQSVCVLDAARVLGRGPWRSFFTVALPLARPAIAVGVVVALMETLNDFGTIDYFGVHTLTAGVFTVWLEMNNPGGAAQISATMLVFVVILIWLERASRRGQRYHHTSSRYSDLPGYRLRGMRAALGWMACALPVLLGFLLPAGILAYYAAVYFELSWSEDFFRFAGNSLLVSGAAAAVTVGMGLFLAYAVRIMPHPSLRFATRLASVGYAVPGAVLAVGVLIPFAWIDNSIDALMRDWFGVSTGLLLTGTVWVLVFAYSVRFLAVSFGAVESSLGKVKPTLDDAARTLGAGALETLRRVHFPMIRGGLLAGAVLVFVDSMKELPATLILRPFNFDTLATYVYQFASDELLEESALGALTIVVAGILPVVMLSASISRSRPGQSGGARASADGRR